MATMIEILSRTLNNLQQLIADVWQSGPLGFGTSDLLLALGIFLFFAILRGLFTRFVLRRVEAITRRTQTQIDDLLREAVEAPLKFFFLVLGVFFGLESLSLSGTPQELADNFVRSLLAIAIFWTFYKTSDPISHALRRIGEVLSPEILSWLMTLFRFGIVATGAATVLQIWGIQIAPIIAGFGLFGVAVALGAQDLFKNLLGGISILVEKRFSIGDWIEVENVVEGTIEQIGFRSTRVRRFDLVPVIVPNNMFADHALINNSQMTHRRIYWKIGLEYRSTVAQLHAVRDNILQWLKDDPTFLSGPRPPCMVYIDSFNDSSIDLMVYCFTEETDWEKWLEHKQRLAVAIKQIVETAGASFAFPSRSIYHEIVPAGVAESMSEMTRSGRGADGKEGDDG